MTALLIIRATIKTESDRRKFDHWYSTDHMPRSIVAMGAEKGWRYWSLDNPAIHYAIYQCASADNFTERDTSALRKEFEQAFPGVTRTRDIVHLVDEFPKS
jgi:hypothetical protein